MSAFPRARPSSPDSTTGLLPKILLLTGSTVLAFVLCELGLRFFLAYLPLRAWGVVPQPLLPLAQYSKRGTIPVSPYILIAGDSYAVGVGDEYRTANRDGRPTFGTAHRLYRRLQRDVVTVGQAGAGSLNGLVARPVGYFEALRRTWLYQVDEPEWLLAYFYEGNDLNNNLAHLRSQLDPTYGRGALYDPSRFREFIARTVAAPEAPAGFTANLFAWQVALLALRARGSPPIVYPEYSPGLVNRVRVGGKDLIIPDAAPSPAMELTDKELEDGLLVLENALIYLQRYFPRTRIAVVYLPSPLSCYELASGTVNIETYEPDGRSAQHEAAAVRIRSDAISTQVSAIAARHSFVYIDTRPSIWNVSRNRPVHGPRDWRHFNEAGYTAVTDAIASALERRLWGALGSAPGTHQLAREATLH